MRPAVVTQSCFVSAFVCRRDGAGTQTDSSAGADRQVESGQVRIEEYGEKRRRPSRSEDRGGKRKATRHDDLRASRAFFLAETSALVADTTARAACTTNTSRHEFKTGAAFPERRHGLFAFFGVRNTLTAELEVSSPGTSRPSETWIASRKGRRTDPFRASWDHPRRCNTQLRGGGGGEPNRTVRR